RSMAVCRSRSIPRPAIQRKGSTRPSTRRWARILARRNELGRAGLIAHGTASSTSSPPVAVSSTCWRQPLRLFDDNELRFSAQGLERRLLIPCRAGVLELVATSIGEPTSERRAILQQLLLGTARQQR